MNGYSQGWDVEMLRTGRYKVEVKVPKTVRLSHLFLSWQDQVHWRSVDGSNPTAQFLLGEGLGRLEIWVQEDEGKRVRPGDNTVTGDAILTLLEE